MATTNIPKSFFSPFALDPFVIATSALSNHLVQSINDQGLTSSNFTISGRNGITALRASLNNINISSLSSMTMLMKSLNMIDDKVDVHVDGSGMASLSWRPCDGHRHAYYDTLNFGIDGEGLITAKLSMQNDLIKRISSHKKMFLISEFKKSGITVSNSRCIEHIVAISKIQPMPRYGTTVARFLVQKNPVVNGDVTNGVDLAIALI